MQPCYFNFLIQIWAVFFNRSFTGLVLKLSSLKCNAVSYELPSKPTELENSYEAGNVTLTFKCISFKISQHVQIFYSKHNIPQVIIQKWGFINRNCGTENHTFCEKE